MTTDSLTFLNGRVFDGHALHTAPVIRFENGHLHGLGAAADVSQDGRCVDLEGDILSPGYVDLQVNGGDGIMFNDDPSPATLARIAEAHRRLGVSALLPTLITDTADKTQAAIRATIEAVKTGMLGIAGLHLEGPHLSIKRKGAHDPALIRPMESEDLDCYLATAKELPVLKLTIAPENVTPEQVRTLAAAGILVSLGHTDASFDSCQHYFAAGARCVTHLFNAMSQLGNREPGLVGAALANGAVSCGLIADAVHVHPESMRAAWQSKTGPGRIFLVSDAMAVAGSDCTEFELGGRRIQRSDGKLTLSDGTLAGADLDLTQAIRTMVDQVGVPLVEALQAAITTPAALLGHQSVMLEPGVTRQSDMIRLSADLRTVSHLM